jgi:N-methylhydantoinase A
VDWRTDHMITRVMLEDAADPAAIAAIYGDLKEQAIDALAHNGIAEARMRIVREIDIRYSGQSMEVRVAASTGMVDAVFVAGAIAAFHAAHLRTFGYNYAGEQKVELVNFCVSGFGVIERPRIPELKRPAGVVAQPKGTRPVYFEGAWHETPVYDRQLLSSKVRLEGPVVVEEFGSTTVVFPGQELFVDPHGILIVGADHDRSGDLQ